MARRNKKTDCKLFAPFSETNIDGHMLFGMMVKNCRVTVINGAENRWIVSGR